MKACNPVQMLTCQTYYYYKITLRTGGRRRSERKRSKRRMRSRRRRRRRSKRRRRTRRRPSTLHQYQPISAKAEAPNQTKLEESKASTVEKDEREKTA